MVVALMAVKALARGMEALAVVMAEVPQDAVAMVHSAAAAAAATGTAAAAAAAVIPVVPVVLTLTMAVAVAHLMEALTR
jgi:hypothetical protein